LEVLAQELLASVAIDSVRNGCRTAGRALGPSGAGRSGLIFVEQSALKLSSIDRAKIVSSAEAALCLVRGKWNIPILANMLDGPVRLGQLRRLIPNASKKVLVQQLHELEKNGIIVRTDFSGKIKHVEYAISVPLGDRVVNLLQLLSDWGLRNAPAIAAAGRTKVPRVPTEWPTLTKSVGKMCTEGAPKRTSKAFRGIIGLGE
jgi:DNA-binding HxlR family transcriptional regulator